MAQLPHRTAIGELRRCWGGLRGRPGAIALVLLMASLAVGSLVLGSMQAHRETIRIDRDAASSPDKPSERGQKKGATKPDKTHRSSGRKSGDSTDEEVVVDVSGAVSSPAVVRLSLDSRVADAIAAAGGLTSDADVSSLNRAAKLSDGEKVYVPHRGETVPSGGGVPQASGGAASASGEGATAPVNINTATAEELDALPGVGPSTAQAIIDDRTQNGPFAGIEDLMRVSGIGEKKFDKLKSRICV